MLVETNNNERKFENSSTEVGQIKAASWKFIKKAPGMRAGTLNDWREGGAKPAGESSKRGQRLRDGR